MLLSKMFEDVKKQWPSDIPIGDCILLDDGEGLRCERLSSLFWEINEMTVHGEWGKLMCWGIVCGLKKRVKTLQQPYPETISLDCLDMEYCIEKIEESLRLPEWQELGPPENDLHTLLKK